MERYPYPTDGRGVPLLPDNLGECYDVCFLGCMSQDRHHLAFNSGEYRSGTERAYREAGSMVIKACICRHRDLHSTYYAPTKPDAQTMRGIAQDDLQPTEAEVWIRSKEMVMLENLWRPA